MDKSIFMNMDKKEIRESLRANLTEQSQVPLAAGVLVLCTETNKILLLLRSSEGTGGNTWNLVSGGIDEGESVLKGLKREVTEEMSINPDIIDYKFIHKEDGLHNTLEFHYYEGFTNSEFIPKLDHENTDYGWFSKEELPSPLFPNIMDKINKIWENQI